MVRIITGTAKNSQLIVPSTAKPISDRAKSTIFSVIGSDIEGQRILDLYAGSGSLGIEALSRGATHCTFVDNAKIAIDDLAKNLTKTKMTEKSTLVKQTAFRFLSDQHADTYDIVFADPPYETYRESGRQLEGLVENIIPVIPLGGAIIIKHPRMLPLPKIETLTLADTRKFGRNAVTLWVKTTAEE